MSNDSDLLTEMGKLHATFLFAKYHGESEVREAAAKLEPVLSRAVMTIAASSEVSVRLMSLSEEHTIDQISLRRCREALKLWNEIFTSRVAVLEATAGDAVSQAVVKTRLALGEDPRP